MKIGTWEKLNEVYQKDNTNFWKYIIEHHLLVEVLNDDKYIKIGFEVARYQRLTAELIYKYEEHLDWGLLCKYQRLYNAIYDKHMDKIDWDIVSLYQHFSEKEIKKYKYKVHFGMMIKRNLCSLEFIEDNIYCFNLFKALDYIGSEHKWYEYLKNKYALKYKVDKIEFEMNNTEHYYI